MARLGKCVCVFVCVERGKEEEQGGCIGTEEDRIRGAGKEEESTCCRRQHICAVQFCGPCIMGFAYFW